MDPFQFCTTASWVVGILLGDSHSHLQQSARPQLQVPEGDEKSFNSPVLLLASSQHSCYQQTRNNANFLNSGIVSVPKLQLMEYVICSQ